ncbi:MAG: hypothetical protein WA354_05765 [Terracidiphilus sp.]
MKVRSVWNLTVVGVAMVILAAALIGWTQYSPTGSGVTIQSLPNPRAQGGFGETIETDPVFAAKRLNALNADRQKSMVSDADKLVKLARQLDAEIASNPAKGLTSEELRKVAEIEKLAHNVKAKMAQSFGGGPQFRPPDIPLGGQGRQ